jgi:hypothetical protein
MSAMLGRLGLRSCSDDELKSAASKENKMLTNRSLKLVTTAMLIGLLPFGAAHSATAICTGPVNFINNHVPGGLYTGIADSGVMRLCTPGATFFRTTAENCKHYISMLSIAFAMNKNVTVYVDNAPTTACSSVPNWFDADVRNVHLHK